MIGGRDECTVTSLYRVSGSSDCMAHTVNLASTIFQDRTIKIYLRCIERMTFH